MKLLSFRSASIAVVPFFRLNERTRPDRNARDNNLSLPSSHSKRSSSFDQAGYDSPSSSINDHTLPFASVFFHSFPGIAFETKSFALTSERMSRNSNSAITMDGGWKTEEKAAYIRGDSRYFDRSLSVSPHFTLVPRSTLL